MLQVILETRAVEASAARYRKEMNQASRRQEAANMPPARRMLMQWFKPLTEAIQEEQRAVRAQRGQCGAGFATRAGGLVGGCWAQRGRAGGGPWGGQCVGAGMDLVGVRAWIW